MTGEEFNLSDKIGEIIMHNDKEEIIGKVRGIDVRYVKEAVRKLKEAYFYLHEGNRHEKLMIDKIDKIFGDKLI